MRLVISALIFLSLSSCGLPKESTLQQIGQEIAALRVDFEDVIKKLTNGKSQCQCDAEDIRKFSEFSLRFYKLEQEVKSLK